MNKPISQPAKRVFDLAQQIVVALYEPHSGNIVHMHTVTMFKGGRVVSEKEAVDTAHKEAASRGHALAGLKTKVSSNYEHAQHCNRVDPDTGEFVRTALSYS